MVIDCSQMASHNHTVVGELAAAFFPSFMNMLRTFEGLYTHTDAHACAHLMNCLPQGPSRHTLTTRLLTCHLQLSVLIHSHLSNLHPCRHVPGPVLQLCKLHHKVHQTSQSRSRMMTWRFHHVSRIFFLQL